MWRERRSFGLPGVVVVCLSAVTTATLKRQRHLCKVIPARNRRQALDLISTDSRASHIAKLHMPMVIWDFSCLSMVMNQRVFTGTVSNPDLNLCSFSTNRSHLPADNSWSYAALSLASLKLLHSITCALKLRDSTRQIDHTLEVCQEGYCSVHQMKQPKPEGNSAKNKKKPCRTLVKVTIHRISN